MRYQQVRRLLAKIYLYLRLPVISPINFSAPLLKKERRKTEYLSLSSKIPMKMGLVLFYTLHIFYWACQTRMLYMQWAMVI